ncbi:MAG: GNAT family N-acetyltransferase [Rhodobacteraceae bacterium]|nr:GNAT family N-acetyltransferase [Paracoccaceae bacterium]
MTVRPLDPVADLAALAGFAPRVADYVELESGHAPGPGWAEAVFAETPPGDGPFETAHLGLFDAAGMQGLAAMAFGYPEPGDAYLGLMLIATEARGRGLGPRLLGAVAETARARGAPRLYLGVLDANPRGRAFWERQGFRHVLTRTGLAFGDRRHDVHRMVLPL